MMNTLLKFFLTVSALFLFTACSPDKTSVKPDTTSGASVSESNGKWIQKELENVKNQMTDNSIPTSIKTTWNDMLETLNADMQKEQISDQLKTDLTTFQTALATEIKTASGDVKTQLETIKSEIDGVLTKVN